MTEKPLDYRFRQYEYQRHEEVEERVVEACERHLTDDISDRVTIEDAGTLHGSDYVDIVVQKDSDREAHIAQSWNIGKGWREIGLVINGVLESSLEDEQVSRFRVWLSYIPGLDKTLNANDAKAEYHLEARLKEEQLK